MSLAPNGKIYMSPPSGARFLHTIHQPDQPGAACDFRQHDFLLATRNAFFLRPYVNYRLLDLPGSACDSLDINDPDAKPLQRTAPLALIYPNPAEDKVYVLLNYPDVAGFVRVFNMAGQLLFEATNEEQFISIPVNDWPAGTYVVQVYQPGEGNWAQKLLIVRG